MTEGDVLYQAILKEPEENDLRLIYADWLDDHGQPVRAEFIRTQIARAILSYRLERFVDKRYLWVADRVTQWASKMAGNSDPIHPRYGCYSWSTEKGECWTETFELKLVYRRGFIDEVRAPLDALGEYLPQIVEKYPVTRVVPTDREPAGWGGAYFWHDSNRDFGVIRPGTSYVTERACDEMVKDGWTYNLLLRTSSLKTEEQAFDALSRAMLRIARSEAGA